MSPRFLAAALILAVSPSILASSFSIKPVQVSFTEGTTSAVLTVSNDSSDALRLQIRVSAWDQNVQGEMQLSPTSDIVFFPALLSLEPNQRRNIRVGVTVKPDVVEKAYRLFITELPSAVDNPVASANQLRILTELGIPIFVRAGEPVFDVRVDSVAIEKNNAVVTIKNAGNTHFTLRAIHVDALDAAGTPILKRSMDGWYVLAGGSRQFSFELAAGDCAKTRSLSIEAETDSNTVSRRWEAPPDVCGP